jgi:hypothetical protein
VAHSGKSNEGKSLMPATAERCERVSVRWLEFGQRRKVTAEDILHCAELACRVRLPEGRMISSARITQFVADDVPLVDPIGVECERLGAYAVVAIEDQKER